MKLDKSTSLFFATKIDSKLREGLAVLPSPAIRSTSTAAPKSFFGSWRSETRRTRSAGSARSSPGPAVTEVDDIQRNLLSILARGAERADPRLGGEDLRAPGRARRAGRDRRRGRGRRARGQLVGGLHRRSNGSLRPLAAELLEQEQHVAGVDVGAVGDHDLAHPRGLAGVGHPVERLHDLEQADRRAGRELYTGRDERRGASASGGRRSGRSSARGRPGLARRRPPRRRRPRPGRWSARPRRRGRADPG